MTRPVLLPENSRSVLMVDGGLKAPDKVPQFVAAFVSTLAAVCMGMLFSWTSSVLPIFEKELHTTGEQGAWIGSLVTLGAFIGAIPTGSFAHKIGRKRTLQLLIVPLFLSWIIIGFFYQYIPIMYLARLVAGFAAGGISVAAPMYVAELASISIRGTLGTFFQVQITIGILLEYILGEIIKDVRTLSLVSAVLPVVFLVSFSFMPESPVYLCEKFRMDEARRNLEWFRGKNYDVEDELTKITEDIEKAHKNEAKFSDLINCKATYKGLIIAFGLMIIQQLSGVNAVLFYSNHIFEESGSSWSPGQCSILVGAVQVIATLGSTLLIDRAGRKLLLIISSLIMCISLATLGLFFYLFLYLASYSFIPLISVALFIIFFSIGFGPIPWLMVGEIFPPKMKGIASSLSASLNWFLAFMVTNQFANMVDVFGSGWTFLIFSFICALGTMFVMCVVPETKGKSVDEVMVLLGAEARTGDGEKNEKITTRL